MGVDMHVHKNQVLEIVQPDKGEAGPAHLF